MQLNVSLSWTQIENINKVSHGEASSLRPERKGQRTGEALSKVPETSQYFYTGILLCLRFAVCRLVYDNLIKTQICLTVCIM